MKNVYFSYHMKSILQKKDIWQTCLHFFRFYLKWTSNMQAFNVIITSPKNLPILYISYSSFPWSRPVRTSHPSRQVTSPESTWTVIRPVVQPNGWNPSIATRVAVAGIAIAGAMAAAVNETSPKAGRTVATEMWRIDGLKNRSEKCERPGGGESMGKCEGPGEGGSMG